MAAYDSLVVSTEKVTAGLPVRAELHVLLDKEDDVKVIVQEAYNLIVSAVLDPVEPVKSEG